MKERDHIIEGDVWVFGILMAIILFVIKAPVLKLPYYWDEMLVYVNPIRLVYERGLAHMIWDKSLFEPLHFFHHPFGLALLFYPILKIFGHSFFLMRFLALAFVWGSLVCTYKIGKRIHSKALGLGGALCFFSLPLVFTQSTMVLGDTVFVFFTTLFFLLLIENRPLWILFLVGLIMGFVRETSLAFVFVSLVYFRFNKRLTLKTFLTSLTPGLGVLFFIFLGSFNHQAFTNGDIALNHFFSGMQRSFLYAFFNGYVDLLLYPAIFFTLLVLVFPKWCERKSADRMLLLLLLVPLIIFVFFMAFNRGILERYFIPVLPFFTLLCFYPLIRFSRIAAFVFLLFFVIKLPHYAYSTNTYHLGTGHETRMEFREVQHVQLEAAQYLAKEFPLKRIWTSWPLDVMLSDSFFGYVSHGLKVVSEDEAKSGSFDIYVWSSNMRVDFLSDADKEQWIKDKKLFLVKEFFYRNKIVRIYKKS